MEYCRLEQTFAPIFERILPRVTTGYLVGWIISASDKNLLYQAQAPRRPCTTIPGALSPGLPCIRSSNAHCKICMRAAGSAKRISLLVFVSGRCSLVNTMYFMPGITLTMAQIRYLFPGRSGIQQLYISIQHKTITLIRSAQETLTFKYPKQSFFLF